jgi:hypothetical protein
MPNKYCDYFNVNESYFPCIDESAINDGAPWDTTYPHDTFIELLKSLERMLGGTTNRSVWIHGAYGTGKSQCALALRRILEVPENEVRTYWDKFDPLKKNKALLEKLIGHKERGIVTAYRYASGDISMPQQLFLAVQESIKKALDEQGVTYKGENSLKESAIIWLEDPAHNSFINSLLQKPEWESTFSQSTADEIINTLKKSSDVSKLMDNIFKLAAKEGITALTLSADSLRAWILDVIKKNDTKIVLIWDEFSDFFRQNKNSLSEFQKLVSICQEAPFYFVVVTHPISSISSNDDSWKIVQQRFDKTEISLPSNIAFDLIGNAFSPKQAAQASWQKMVDDLDGSLNGSRKAIMKATDVKSDDVIKRMLPIHPMAALVLKNIATAYQANQRSMFDFIKTPKDLDTKAFQWFIQQYGPEDDRPLLTVDMLWNFFYEKGKEHLSSDIKLILDTFPQQTMLREDEKIVLKTILIMQAIDQRLGGSIDVLKPTDQNLSYAFEGDNPQYEATCKGIAKGLVDKGILIQTPIADGKKVYNAAVLAGDGAKIEGYKKEIRDKGTTAKLISEGPGLAASLTLTPALKLRYATAIDTGYLPVVTSADFIKTMDALKHKDAGWHFYAVLALAKTEDEAQSFRNLIKKTVSNEEYKNIVVIDALSTPLGLEAFEQYVDYSAMALYYNGNNNQQSKENNKKAKDVLEREWKDRIHDGQFIVYSYAEQDGEKATGANAVHTILQTIVLSKYRHVFDFTKNLTETQLRLTQAKQVSRYGMGGTEVKGLIAGCEKSVLSKVWNREDYWKIPELAEEHIVIIKKAVDKLIKEAFDATGKISLGEIYDYLEGTFGFSQCNLSAFITGFLLKEYSSDPYRSMNAEGHRDSMTPDKLSEMIGNYIGKGNAKPTYIVSLTDEEKAFYELTEEAWNIAPNTCSSPSHAGALILARMRELNYPVWCLEDVDHLGVFDIVKKFIALVQSKGDDAHDIANDIGKIAMQRPSSAKNLKDLLTAENCKKGIQLFLERFDGGKLIKLAKEIGAEEAVLTDIKKLFSVQYSALWIGSTGEDEIRRLTNEYEVVKLTNILLNVATHSKDAAFKAWRESLKFVGFSCELVRAKRPSLDKFFYNLLRIANFEDMLPDNIKSLLDEMLNRNAEIRGVLGDTLHVFTELYAPYLDGFSDVECEEIKNSITSDMFVLSATQSNGVVKKAAEDYKKNQIKSQLFKMWNDKTNGTKNPRVWSAKYQTPILCLIPEEVYGDAKKAFAILNSNTQTEFEIKSALEFIQSATFFQDIAGEEYRDRMFMQSIVGRYSNLLSNVTEVRNTLDKTGIDVYEWSDSPVIKAKIKAMAELEYNAGGSDRAIETINSMSSDELKEWLKDLAKKDIELGVKIIDNGGK